MARAMRNMVAGLAIVAGSAGGAFQPPPEEQLHTFPAHWIVEESRPMLPVFDAALVVARGRIALLGGITKALETTQAIQIRDEARGWLPVGSQMLEPRARHTATPLGDGRVLVVGGVQGTIGGELLALASCEALDPFGAGSVAVDPLDEPLVGHTAHRLLNGLVAVIGGEALRLFDPASMTWIARVELQKRRANHASLIIEGGDLLIIGGDDVGSIERVDLPDSFSEPRGEVDMPIDQSLLDSITTTIAADIPGGALSHCAALGLLDGNIWIVGGLDGQGRSVRDTWFIDVTTLAVSPGPGLPIEGGVAGVELLRAGGNAIIVGGETHSASGRTPSASAFMYENEAGRLWRLPDVPAIPVKPGEVAGASSRRLWFLDESGRVAAEGGYRFVNGEDAERTGETPGVRLASERVTLRIGHVPVLID